MAEPSRYNVSKEDQHPVLKNKLGITDQKMLDDTETLLLSDTYKVFFDLLKEGALRFNLKLIFKINDYFLNTLYDWAGKLRTVEMSKDGIMFCASSQINKELGLFDKLLSKSLSEVKNLNKTALAEKLAVIHCEFNAIHPFREGNGRTIRLFLDLISVYCGYEPIDFGEGSQKSYIRACVARMQKDYSKMEDIIIKGLFKNPNL